MSQNKTSSSSAGVLKGAQFLLGKLAALSATTLFATAAYADNCPDLNSILHGYFKDKTLMPDYQLDRDQALRNTTNFWKLSSEVPQPYITFQNADLKVVKVELKTLAKGASPLDENNVLVDPTFYAIDTVTCEYKDKYAHPDSKDRLVLTTQSFGQLRIPDYISYGGKIIDDTNWILTVKNPSNPNDRNKYECSGASLDNGTCGKFIIRKKVDQNGWWNDAWYWCYSSYAECKGDNGYIARVNKLDNTAVTFQYFYGPATCRFNNMNVPCTPVFPNPTKCKDILCTEEINTMNLIFGGSGTKMGLAEYVRMCWGAGRAKLNWKNKAWDGKYYKWTADCNYGDPTGTWPDYADFGINPPL